MYPDVSCSVSRFGTSSLQQRRRAMTQRLAEVVEAVEAQTPAPATKRWDAWDDFLSSTPHTGFMQSSSWADFRLALGYEHFGAIVSSRGRILGGAIVQKCWYSPQQCFYYVQDGPVLPSDEMGAGEIFQLILDEIERNRANEEGTVSHLRIEPRWGALPDFVVGFHA